MAKRAKSGGRNSQRSTAGVIEVPKGSRPEGPVEGVYYVDTGDCELIADQDNSNGWLLKINGVMSSHIDLADPLFLDFEYMRWMAALIESRWPPQAGKSGARVVPPAASGTQKLRGLHLGGGACSLARYFHAAYPDARQVVVELDGNLAESGRGGFDLPKAPFLRPRGGDARELTAPPHPARRAVRALRAGDAGGAGGVSGPVGAGGATNAPAAVSRVGPCRARTGP